MIQKLLLSCGIYAPVIYFGMDVLAGKLIKGYDFSAQSMSELAAAGSPTRQLVCALTVVASILLITFGVGVWCAVGPIVLPRIVAGLIIGNSFFGLIATLFFPNTYGVEPTFGTPGVLLMAMSVLCFVLAMVFGALAFSGWIRVLSIAIPASYVFLTVLRLATAAGTAVMSGSQERTMAYSFLAWVVALAIYLLVMVSKTTDTAG